MQNTIIELSICLLSENYLLQGFLPLEARNGENLQREKKKSEKLNAKHYSQPQPKPVFRARRILIAFGS